VRHQARETNDLLNAIAAKFGKSIVWTYAKSGHILLNDGSRLYFDFHGNRYADYLKFMHVDVAFLERVKYAFPDDFKAEIQREEALLE
jgi:hypothetical protein